MMFLPRFCAMIIEKHYGPRRVSVSDLPAGPTVSIAQSVKKIKRNLAERRIFVKSWKKWIFPCLCFAWMIVIWHFSLAPAEESAAESSGVQDFLNGVLEKTGLSVRLSSHVVRKTAHFTEFFVLGVLATASMLALGVPYPFLPAAVCPILTAVVDETIQRFVPGRAALLTDVLLDSAGGCAGVLCFALIWWVVWVRRKKHAAPAGSSLGNSKHKRK